MGSKVFIPKKKPLPKKRKAVTVKEPRRTQVTDKRRVKPQ